jgi:pimeloyl-ACP methyl ester carboxylesterase
MRRIAVREITIVLALLLTTTMQTADTKLPLETTQSLRLQPCEVRGIEGKAQCGTLDVYENRAAKKGRKISLKVLVLPATGNERSPDPLFYIPGGPGSSATEDAPGVARQFAKIRERRDLVFLDQRGTGGSHALECKFYNENDPQSYLGYFFPLEDVKRCREELEKQADLKMYTTPIAMDDLDDVRAALGYQQINIFGGSYGTRAAMVYLRQHPNHVRSLILQGAVPTNIFLPRDFASDNECALQLLIDECAADQACNKEFPTLRTDAKTLLDRLLKGPVEVEVRIRNPSTANTGATTAATAKVKLSRDLAAEAIRYMLYNPGGSGRVPLFLHQAATGNFVPLAQQALRFRQGLVATGSNGMYLSITCAEDLPWIKPGEGERRSANTFLGDYRVRQQREACALWPRAKIPSDYAQPVRGTAPVLILTGRLDPVTPPANGDTVARHLPNSLHVVVPYGGHGFGGLDGIECIERLMAEFVEKGTTTNLDTGCVKNIRRKAFALK